METYGGAHPLTQIVLSMIMVPFVWLFLAAETQAARERLSDLFPRGFELVYDNYNALAFGFGPTDRPSDVLVSVAAYPRWVTLFFLKGATLPDPDGVLQGSGRQVRSVRLAPISVLHSPPVKELLRLAIAGAQSALAFAPPLTTIVKIRICKAAAAEAGET